MGILRRLLDALGLGRQRVNVLIIGLDNSGKTTALERLKPRHKQLTEVTPTVGLNVEQFVRGNLKFTAFDMSGAGRYRPLWEQYTREAHALVFVIDSADRLRVCGGDARPRARTERHLLQLNALVAPSRARQHAQAAARRACRGAASARAAAVAVAVAAPRAPAASVVAKDELDNMLAHAQLGKRVPLLLLANKMDLPGALAPAELAQALRLEEIRERPWQIVPSNALTGEGIDRGLGWLAEKLPCRS